MFIPPTAPASVSRGRFNGSVYGRSWQQQQSTTNYPQPPSNTRGAPNSSNHGHSISRTGSVRQSAGNNPWDRQWPRGQEPRTNPHPQPSERGTNRPEDPYQGLSPQHARPMTRGICRVGMVFRAGVHEQDYRDKYLGGHLRPDDQYTVQTNWGHVYSKLRWQIIIAVHANNYITVPIYTHAGQGLRNKTENEKMECVSIRDHRNRGQFINQSQHKKFEAVMLPGTTLLDPVATVQLTHPITRQFDLLIEEQGRLEADSVDRLLALYRRLNSV